MARVPVAALLLSLASLSLVPVHAHARPARPDSVTAARRSAPRSWITFAAELGREHDDNVLQLTRRNLDRFTTNPGAPRFLIPQVGDVSTTFTGSARYRARPLPRRETRVALEASVTRFDHDTVADWERYGLSVSQELTATRRRLLTLELYGSWIPAYYLGEITDLDESVALGDRVRQSLTYEQTRLGARLRQAMWRGRLEASGALEREHRDYSTHFTERDNTDETVRLGLDATPWPRWPVSADVTWERGDRNARGDIPDPLGVVDTDISFDHDGYAVGMTLPWGRGAWRGRADGRYAREVRRYTTRDKFDIIRFGRENHRRDTAVRITQRVWGPVDAVVSWSRLTSRAEFHEGITFPAEQTNFAQERFGAELRARWEWDLR